ncbi:uncharacterized protein Z518_04091 [Rhinocladiella mackenziei CBS 650.93]|uniref:Zn(2)-C6 fungal-type domain-containing protein n=1 Tax=Rhinocladiella mackenziei CBS 650.93 TaxID=1442369 RepID=A0A0D2FVF2_9EURO|nr:uncharacterized protein Z518_04091 [Rhinocladiella mackenziei CBS 650.93]KIX06117.1 hypothetical protein Z518_04091 [Rhinocladiella mackenziei CBS 650.93]
MAEEANNLTPKATQQQSARSGTINLSGRARARGRSNVARDRCGWCIVSRKGCDSVKPVCGNCRKNPERCEWPAGNPSRSGLTKLRMSRIFGEENLQHSTSDDDHNDAGTAEEGLTSSDMAGAQLATSDQQVRRRSVSPFQVFEQDEQLIARVILAQPCPVDQQAPRSLSPGMQRLEQVRVRVLESTRVYLGNDSQLPVNTQERRGIVGEAQNRQSQEQIDSQDNSPQVQQDSDFKLSISGSDAETNDEDLLRAWLTPGVL